MTRLLIVLLWLSVAFHASAQHDYQHAAGFKYIEVVKNTTHIDADLPIIIGFHYSSSTPQEAVNDYDQLNIPVRIILPQGNFKKRSGYTYYPTDFYSNDSLMQISISTKTLDSVAAFVKQIGDQYKRKPIVAGFSQGGDLSFLLAVYYPKLISAAFPLAGFIHRQRFDDVKKYAHKSVPIFIHLGEADKIVSLAYAKKELEILKPYFTLSLKTYPGLGHDFSPAMKKDYADLMAQILH